MRYQFFILPLGDSCNKPQNLYYHHYSYIDQPNCTVACIEKNGDIYCNPRCDLPKELQCKLNLPKDLHLPHDEFAAYPDHLKPDVLVKYDSEFMNVVVYVVGSISTLLLLGMKILHNKWNSPYITICRIWNFQNISKLPDS